MTKKAWVYDPHSGGVKIPEAVRERTRNRILAHAASQYAGKYTRIDVHFRGQLCYIDAYTEPCVAPDFDPTPYGESREAYIERLRNNPIHLGRLRYFGDEDQWSYAFFTYSHEKYEPSVFDNGTFHGTPEEAFDMGAVYLND
ncbi:hypothetical protein [uncultured Thiodictyon sp.]|uniref:hypothetical protein n=1 Tax=uncultured Thiodictyon sp. TaxID=1846217 RepID=UPI0025DB0F92|nr:hypothetical protein [uncultured Thiodictyon sp.]